MHNLDTYLLRALAAYLLLHASLAEDHQSGFVCLIEDTNRNHCDSFCLTELRPMLNQVIKAQDRGKTHDADFQQDKLEGQLQEVQAKLEGQLKGVEAKLDKQLQEGLTKMNESQAKLEGNLKEILIKMENQLQTVLNKMETSQQVANVKAPNLDKNTTIPPGFQRIGTRYYLKVHEVADNGAAERRCRELGGYLASFRDAEETIAVMEKLPRSEDFFLGINDRDREGYFVSVASQKPVQFQLIAPKDRKSNCFSLSQSRVWTAFCSDKKYFICQADNET